MIKKLRFLPKKIKGERNMKKGGNIDIIRNVKIIEWLKCELLTSIAKLFELLAKGVENTKDDILDIISNVILVSYLLGKRLGLSYETINLKVENKIKLGMIEEHKIEKWYGDLSELNENFSNRRGE